MDVASLRKTASIYPAVRAEEELAEVQADLVASVRALQAEREVSNTLSRKVQEFGKYVETICAELDTAKDELGALKESLSSKVRLKKSKWRVLLRMVFIQRMSYCSAVVSAG